MDVGGRVRFQPLANGVSYEMRDMTSTKSLTDGGKSRFAPNSIPEISSP